MWTNWTYSPEKYNQENDLKNIWENPANAS